MEEHDLDAVNRRLAEEGYPPIRRLPADDAAIVSWKRVVDARRELERTGKLSPATLLAVSSFCHCLKCPAYPRGELPVYCFGGKSKHGITPINCLCPSCEVYKVSALTGTDYYCMVGAPGKKLLAVGGAVGAAAKFLQVEIDKGNPGKRIPERGMSAPNLAGLRQDDYDLPEKVPGAE